MSSNQTLLHDPDPAKTASPIGKLRLFIRDRLFETAAATIAGSLLITGTSGWNIWSIYNNYQSSVSKNFELQKVQGDLIYQDEYLTMSAKMLASTGESSWETRYNQMVPPLEASLKRFTELLPEHLKEEQKKTDASAAKLLDLETKSFQLVKEGKKDEAYKILTGEEYNSAKKLFSDTENKVLKESEHKIRTELNNYQQQLLVLLVFAGAALPILIAAWALVLSAIRDYIRDRRAAEAMAVSRDELLKVNDRLNQEVEIRAQQERQIRQESETLQADIGHILDVVCSLEEGDLKVQAEVNDRATGLISDTLNRLTESLSGIISAVVNTTQQVTVNAGELELLAVETARKAQSQTKEVGSVQSLLDNINQLTTDSRQQAIATATAVQQAKSAVSTGRLAIQDTTAGIETLQQGTEQIVRRAQLLNEFVELAAQFSKEQKRVAALTRVLALNVSTLSSRALDERDPEQFAILAKEFGTIATQVNTLAIDTDRSLISLQQRTDSVQTVTSGLTQDINEIEQLVQKFTTEIGKSRLAFDNIQSVTEEVDLMSARVNESSQDIVNAVVNTLSAIRSISEIAQTTEAKAAITQAQVQSMGDLATKLLQMVEFFQISQASQTATPKQLAQV